MSWMKCLLVVCGFVCAASAETVLPRQFSEERPLTERFQNPPASARILRILHSQHDIPAEQDKILKELADQGFGGFAGNVNFAWCEDGQGFRDGALAL
jgi:hypothetical protein